MKLNINYKTITAIFLLFLIGLSAACQKQAAQNSNASNTTITETTTNSAATKETTPTVKTIKPESPTEAYKMLYEAVKAKDTEKIKQLVTKNTDNLAQFMSAQQKQPVEKSYENGFTSTTFAPTMPEVRDERIKGDFGALEVYSQKDNRWEDLPFMFEDGGWRLAVGDVFQGKYESPGKGKSQIEREASNKSIPPANAVNKKSAANSDPINSIPPANIRKGAIPPDNESNK